MTTGPTSSTRAHSSDQSSDIIEERAARSEVRVYQFTDPSYLPSSDTPSHTDQIESCHTNPRLYFTTLYHHRPQRENRERLFPRIDLWRADRKGHRGGGASLAPSMGPGPRPANQKCPLILTAGCPSAPSSSALSVQEKKTGTQ